jgi:ribonuclease HI
MAGKAVLNRGMIKRIGNGASTHIWHDRWIPLHFDARPITLAEGQDVSLVSELLTEEGQWNEQLIRDIFVPVDAEAIMRILVCLQDDDWWAWEPKKHGDYMVKSAYRKLVSMAQGETVGTGGSGDETWSKVWKMIVPPKVKVFWWRVLHEFLPAKEILNRRHIDPTAFCERCGAERESINHALIECTVAKIFWQQIKQLTGAKLPHLHHATWASDLMRDEVCNEKNRSIFIIGMYSLWTQRNRRRHGEAELPIVKTVQWCVDTAMDFWQICRPSRQAVAKRPAPSWSPPPEGWLKCNVDGAFYSGLGEGATGAVMRDVSGTFLGGRAAWYRHGLDALTMEALACRDGAVFAQEKGVQNLIIETDSQELLKLWGAGVHQRSRIAPIVRETRDITMHFSEFKLLYASRCCNRVAHTLAKQVSGDTRLGEWQHAPSCVVDLLTVDCNPDEP